jgi:threonylcarbamoyladenosine tRNA methylthiotransferase MtaB
MAQSFHIITLGCRVNQCESDLLSGALEKNGLFPAGENDKTVDICIINTCAVTGKAEMQSRQAIRHARKVFPSARILATGCYAESDPEKLQEISDVDRIIGNRDKHRIPDLVLETTACPLAPDFFPSPTVPLPIPGTGGRTRPHIKIQDGCNAYCTYCIVPHTRGRSRSMNPEAVEKRIADLDQAGYPEIVLTGIHIGRYGLDLDPDINLTDLLQRIIRSDGRLRIRLSSIEPLELTDELIALAAQNPRLCHHFHVPLQSGDNGILKRMHRPYTREQFAKKVWEIRSCIPDAAIGTDVMAGFPGETEAAFGQTVELLENLPITYLHVFPFSPRRGTPAAGFADPVDPVVIKKRCRILRDLGDKKKQAFWNSVIGQYAELVVESRRDPDNGMLKGLTSHYIPVLVDGTDDLKHRLVRVRLLSIGKKGAMTGDLCQFL